ncbi:MAG: tRNA epoxyqueuosine(34) reductase QueG [Cyanobacteria bacterium PR.3.49]|nr:tRNA epoxyqueuosine(34) reductase QueG [Cyanobacteria bacterium PR.3.49]
MTTQQSLKESIKAAAAELGFQRTVIASLAPMESERQEYERWLALGYAAGMEYLKRNPHFRTSPQLLYPEGRSAIVVSVSYYSEVPPPPAGFFGKVARYAVGLDYHAVIRAKLRELNERIEKIAGRKVLAKAFTDDVSLFEQGLAARHGLGFAGRHTLIIGPQMMGTYNFVAELITDLELDADEPYEGTCGKCFRCGEGCPTDAIEYGVGVNSNKCISYLTIENKGGIPLGLRKQLGRWVFGCDVCQDVCPYNGRPNAAPWEEFSPDKGTGHYLDLFSILDLESETAFRERFAHTPLRRPKLRGLSRNSLTVIGNILADESRALQCTLSEEELSGAAARLVEYIETEPEPMLREHAYWALAQFDCAETHSRLKSLIVREKDSEISKLTEEYLSANTLR